MTAGIQEEFYANKNMEYIQNRTNWCWAVACKVVGEQYRKNHDGGFRSFNHGNKDTCGSILQKYGGITATDCMEGLRLETVKNTDGIYYVDGWQKAIVMHANSMHRGVDGNFPGDDMAKLQGLNFVVTGECESSLVQTVSLGSYDSEYSILYYYHNQLKTVFKKKNYLIGNAVLYPKMICHSFILLEWGQDDKIAVYDPWDGCVAKYTVQDLFFKGFPSAQGAGIIKWVQYIE